MVMNGRMKELKKVIEDIEENIRRRVEESSKKEFSFLGMRWDIEQTDKLRKTQREAMLEFLYEKALEELK